MSVAAVLATIFLSIAAPGFAQETPEERNSLIRLGTRVFDFAIDVRSLRRDPHFIPITDVPWIYAVKDRDPHLDSTIIHIESMGHHRGEPIWLPDQDREQYAPAEDLAELWGLNEFDVRWRHKVAPSTRGDLVLIPKAADAGYYVSCGFERTDPVPRFCAVDALYPPDPDLRIRVRVYKVTDPINDFRAITQKAMNLVYCLDVTEEIEAMVRPPSVIDGPDDLTGFLSTCRNISV